MKLPRFEYLPAMPRNIRKLRSEQSRVHTYIKALEALHRPDWTNERLRLGQKEALDYLRQLSTMMKARLKRKPMKARKAKRPSPPKTTRKPNGPGPKAKAANKGRSLTPDEIACYAALKGFAV